MKFLKVGRVAIITHGRYAGKKVVIIQPVDSGNKAHPFGHALVAGIERYPSKITRRMSKTRQEKRNKIKPFVKLVNYNHLMPTRYTLELEGLKGVVSNDTFKEVTQREDAKKTVKKVLEERYTSGKNRWFFTPLNTIENSMMFATRDTSTMVDAAADVAAAVMLENENDREK
ncbi:putative ribosomal protein L27 [Colletotrichum sublineola]|uniref:Putative ribosomal protein L27 n=1 Tax=Colletotrichum sublineola TaxID=1173701 RepID=A0A066XKT0_COLSU|nr:putative ribosomal protein L27 [Colletotrichum sublineola]